MWSWVKGGWEGRIHLRATVVCEEEECSNKLLGFDPLQEGDWRKSYLLRQVHRGMA